MTPRAYVTAYLERAYLAAHPELTPDARALLHGEVSRAPERYAAGEHARSLVAYMQLHERLMREMDRLEDIADDDEYERRRGALFGDARHALHEMAEADHLNVDARLTEIMLADVPLDACINDLLRLETRLRADLPAAVPGFDADAPRFWDERALAATGETVAERTASQPEVVGYLHTLEALAQLCLASARYTVAARYARRVMHAQGYPTMAVGVLLLALARLEREDEFFEVAAEGNPCDPEGRWGQLDDSPWFLLGRTILLYKAGRGRAATRALRDFAARCEGGAFFLLNPTSIAPYLPVRPPVREAWELTHQAAWEADPIIADVPDFPTWATGVEGIEAASEDFARRHGF